MNKKWNLIILIQNILRSSDDRYFNLLIEELLALKFNENIKIHMVVTIHEDQEILNINCTDDVSINSLTSFVFEIKRYGEKKLKLLLKKENLNLAIDTELITLLKVIPVEKKERLMVLTWDHGAGLAFFLRTMGSSFAEKINTYHTQVPSIPFNKNNDRFLMSIDEFILAFKSVYKRKIDFLLMMNCYMLVFDNCLALSKKFKYIIAGQTAMGFNGYLYQDIISAIQCNNISNDVLMSKLIESSKNIDIVTRYKQETANFGFKLNYFAGLNFLFNLLLKNEMLSILENKEKYLSSRANCKDFVAIGYEYKNTYQLLDFIKTIKIIKKTTTFKSSKIFIFFILFLFKKAKHKNFYIGEAMEEFNLTGISLVFPENTKRASSDALYQKFYNTPVYSTSFLEKSKWPGFLKSLFS